MPSCVRCFERLRRPRAERNIINSAQLAAALDPAHAERLDEVERLRLRYVEVPEDGELAELLDWDAPVRAKP